MTVPEVAQQLGLRAVTTLHDHLIEGVIVSDLLSNVLANAAPGYIWVTIQVHRNVAMVASAQNLAAVIVCGGREPAAELVELAADEHVVILVSDDMAYEVCGRLYELGVR